MFHLPKQSIISQSNLPFSLWEIKLQFSLSDCVLLCVVNTSQPKAH